MNYLIQHAPAILQGKKFRTAASSPLFWIGSISILALVLLAASTTPVSGTDDNAAPSCPLPEKAGRTIIDFPDSWRLVNRDGSRVEGPMSVSIEAGTYDITLVSYDDHSKNQTQHNESYFVELRNGSTTVLTSNPISDLPDSQDILIELVQHDAVLSHNATKLFAVHNGGNGAGSIDPICAALDNVTPPPPPPTEAPIVTLAANPHNVDFNGSSTLTWNVTNANICTASGDWSGSKNANGGSETVSKLTQNRTYILTCFGSGGSAADDATIFVDAEPSELPTVDLFANPSIITSGDSSILSWNVTNANICTASGDWSGSKNANGGSETTTNITGDRTYILTCAGSGGTTTDIATVQVRSPEKPVVVLTADPTTVSSGGSSVLIWTVLNANICTASGDWSGSKNPNHGSETRSNITSNRTYILTCAGNGGSSTDTATVTRQTIAAPPSVSLIASPSLINSGSAATILWSVSNANSCVASGDWSGSRSANGGSLVETNITSDQFYALTCTGDGGSRIDTATVGVINQTNAPSVSLNANPSIINRGNSTTLNWSVQHAANCTASGGWSGLKNAVGGSETRFSIQSNQTYTLTCSGNGGVSSDTTAVFVQETAQAPTVNLSASPTAVNFGNATTLFWNVSNANTCSASEAWSGFKSATSGSELRSNLTATSGYTLTCSGPGGSASDSITVSVLPTEPPPAINVLAGIITDQNGAPVSGIRVDTCHWGTHTTNANGQWSVSIPQRSNYCARVVNLPLGFTGVTSSNNTPETQFANTYEFQVSGVFCRIDGCDSGIHSTWDIENNLRNDFTVFRSTTPPPPPPPPPSPTPTLTLTANPPSILIGESSLLSWNSNNTTSCSATSDWSGFKPLAGSESTGNLTETRTYILTCTGENGSITRSVSVAVETPPLPTITLTAIDLTTLEWEAIEANICVASGSWSGFKPLVGSQFVGKITPETQYLLTCSGSGGTVTVAASGAANTLATALISTGIAGGITTTTTVTDAAINDAQRSANEAANSRAEEGFLAAIFGGSIGATVLFWLVIIAALLLFLALMLSSRRRSPASTETQALGGIPSHATRQPPAPTPPIA